MGFREDVCQAIKDSGATTLRYPGGNFDFVNNAFIFEKK